MNFEPINDPYQTIVFKKYKLQFKKNHPGYKLGYSNILRATYKNTIPRIKYFFKARELRKLIN